jgi:hypothetical protein
MDAAGQALLRKTTETEADDEIVWSWCPDAGTKFVGPLHERLAGDGSKKARFPGRARINRNTIAQGRPDVSAFTCGSFPVLFLMHGGRGCGGHPAFPAPSVFGGQEILAKLGRDGAARMRKHVSPIFVMRNSKHRRPGQASRSGALRRQGKRRSGTHNHRRSLQRRRDDQLA